MGSFSIYLLKSVVWLIGFAIVFLIFLRNERYFGLNRIYLLSGIIASMAFPFCTWYYTVFIPTEQTSTNTVLNLSTTASTKPMHDTHIIWWLYAAGIGLLAIRLIWQTVKIIQKLRQTGYESKGSVKLVRTDDYAVAFSFFSYIFVNPSISDIEAKEILMHEIEHINQKHWFDLLLAEILCMLQWFNPFVWIYAHLIRENHEFMADESVLRHSSSPAHYKAILLNQLIGDPVIRLSNSFNYSLNKKRFKMMKKSMHSPLRKIKLLLIIPLMALVFYAFAEPDFKTITSEVILSDKANMVNDGLDPKYTIAKETTIIRRDTDTIKVKPLLNVESKKNLREYNLSAVDSVYRISEKSQEKSYPINEMTGDSTISKKSKIEKVYIGHPIVSRLKLPKTLVGYSIALGYPTDRIVFPNNKQIKFAYGINKDFTLFHNMSGSTLLKSIGVSQIKFDIPNKPLGIKVGHPYNMLINDSTINRH